MSDKINELVNDNLPKGSNRILITVSLIAVTALFGQNIYLNSTGNKYDKHLHEECQRKLDKCNELRFEDSQNYINKIEEYSKIIDQVKKEVSIKTQELDNKIKQVKK